MRVGRCLGGSFSFEVGKSLAGLGVDRLETCSVGEALDDYIAIMVIEVDAISPPTGLLGRDERRPAARYGVEYDAAPLGAAYDRIGDQRDGRYGRVQGELGVPVPAGVLDELVVGANGAWSPAAISFV